MLEIKWNLTTVKVKVKCTLVQALRLCTGRMAYRGSRGIALTFHDHVTRRGCGVSVTPRPLFTPGEDPLPILHEAGWAPGLVWTGVENVAPTRIRSSGRPAHSHSLYWLHYLAQLLQYSTRIIYAKLNVWNFNVLILILCIYDTNQQMQVTNLHTLVKF
jgi:hypothetical protein